ncbi:MAG: AsnC family transcriptional regulator [uncultured bacterium]|nr:MAG: AsnC family transcriptional regulator [uncultured bacterium]
MDEILKILKKDGRQSIESIASQLELTCDQVKKKIDDYEKKGIILRYKAIINDRLLGEEEETRALIEVKVRPQKDKGFDGIAEKIYKFPEVVSCMLVSGTFDLLLEVTGDNIHTISNFVSQKLSQIENVQSTVTHFLLKKYKEGGDILTVEKKDERLAICP